VHAVAAKKPRGSAHALLVERPQLLAAEVQTAADLAHKVQRHDAFRFHPEIGIAIAFGDRLAGDFDDVPETSRDDQAERADLSLQQGVGGDRRAVGEPCDVIGPVAGLRKDRPHPPHEPDRRISRRARDLGDSHGARAAIDRNDIGESSAGINANSEPRLSGRLWHAASCSVTRSWDAAWDRPFASHSMKVVARPSQNAFDKSIVDIPDGYSALRAWHPPRDTPLCGVSGCRAAK
jgi:hypothetical protein